MNEIRFNNPAQSGVSDQTAPKENKKFFKKTLKFFVAIVILLVVILLVFFARDFVGGMFKNKSESYSAVFLSNGQVYFGKITQNNDSEIVLNNVFYILDNKDKSGGVMFDSVKQSSFDLIKMNNELHGPTDEFFIKKSQIIFFEELKNDSVLVKFIKNYKE